MTDFVPNPNLPCGPTSRFCLRATICGRTEIGPTRTENQDAIVVNGVVGLASGSKLNWRGEIPASGLGVAVIDGMGGHAGGAEAAALVASSLAKVNFPDNADHWERVFENISHRVTRAGFAWGMADMGATAAVLGITSSALVIANVGDCRVYRAVGGHLGQLSVDDRTIDPNSSAVTQALGGTTKIDAHFWQQDLKEGHDRYVLCSDGVYSVLNATILRDLCTADISVEEIVDAIAASVYTQRAQDNCSVIILDLFATPREEAPQRVELPSSAPIVTSVSQIRPESNQSHTHTSLSGGITPVINNTSPDIKHWTQAVRLIKAPGMMWERSQATLATRLFQEHDTLRIGLNYPVLGIQGHAGGCRNKSPHLAERGSLG